MTKHDYEEVGNGGAGVFYFLVGAVLGSLIAFLFAPQSGVETREAIAQKAYDAKDYAQRTARDVGDRANSLIDQGKQLVSDKAQQVSAAVDAGREAYTQEIARGKAASD